jgi:hypothetical protein
MLKHLFLAKRRRPAPRHVRPAADTMPRLRWYS